MSSLENLEAHTCCKWHYLFDPTTSNCNIFRQLIQSPIDKGRLRFAKSQQDDQLTPIGLDGKGLLNRQPPTDLSID